MRAHLFLLMGFLSFVGCGGGDSQPSPGSSVVVDPHGNVPDFNNTSDTRTADVRRLKIDALQASVSIIAGKDANGQPIVWKTDVANTTVDGLSNAGYGKVLGRPDYVSVMTEQDTPSSLYMKLVRDMAKNVCDQMIQADIARPPNEPRTLWRFAKIDGSATDDEIRQNLVYLVLRYTGYRFAKDEPMIDGLQKAYTDAIAGVPNPSTANPPAATEGWRAVCIALFEDPALHLE